MKFVEAINNNYEIIKNEDNFVIEDFNNRITDYFNEFDYIVGDYAYSKLRLKGFNKKSNKYFNSINDFNLLDKYLKENCAYGCKYFILEKVNKKNI